MKKKQQTNKISNALNTQTPKQTKHYYDTEIPIFAKVAIDINLHNLILVTEENSDLISLCTTGGN